MLIGTEEKKCKKMASTQETKRPKKILKKKMGNLAYCHFDWAQMETKQCN